MLSLGVQDDQERRVAKRLRTRAVERLWNLTEELNVLYRDNWTALADREMMRCGRGRYRIPKYRLTKKVLDLGWVDLDLECSIFLLGQ